MKYLFLLLFFSSSCAADTGLFKVKATEVLLTNTFPVLDPHSLRPLGTSFSLSTKSGTVLVSNYHVCANFLNIKVPVKTKNTINYVSILYSNFNFDLCILEGVVNTGIKIDSDENMHVKLYTYGFPSREARWASGFYKKTVKISLHIPKFTDKCPNNALQLNYGVQQYCIMTIVVNDTTIKGEPGGSGSPVVNEEGKLLGIINSVTESTKELSMLPLSYLTEALEDLGLKRD